MSKVIRVPDPAIVEMKRICVEVLGIQFMNANLNEANFGLDQVDQLEEKNPIFILISTLKDKVRVLESGLMIRDIPVFGFMVQAVDMPSIDFTTEEVDPYIHEMRQYGDKLVYELNKSNLSDKTSPILTFDFDKTYQKFDKHLFGGGMTFTWSYNTGKRGC